MSQAHIPTPPRDTLKELPDYFLGCLIYYDDTPDNSMKWICYDGRQKYRCISRQAAENCARQLKNLVTQDGVGHLITAHHFLTRAYHAIDKAAAECDTETRLWLELQALDVRKLADAIDLLISQKIKRINNL